MEAQVAGEARCPEYMPIQDPRHLLGVASPSTGSHCCSYIICLAVSFIRANVGMSSQAGNHTSSSRSRYAQKLHWSNKLSSAKLQRVQSL